MKVLHISTGDSSGGAARAAYRIHSALMESGVDSRMCVLQSGTADERVSVAKSPFHRNTLEPKAPLSEPTAAPAHEASEAISTTFFATAAAAI